MKISALLPSPPSSWSFNECPVTSVPSYLAYLSCLKQNNKEIQFHTGEGSPRSNPPASLIKKKFNAYWSPTYDQFIPVLLTTISRHQWGQKLAPRFAWPKSSQTFEVLRMEEHLAMVSVYFGSGFKCSMLFEPGSEYTYLLGIFTFCSCKYIQRLDS